MFNPSSAQDLVNAGFHGYAGWGDAEAVADFRATGGSGKGSLTSGGGGATGDVTSGLGGLVDLAKQLTGIGQEAAAPAIEQAKGFMSDINSRYDKLLGEFKERAGTTASRESGKRGVPISSISAQQFIGERQKQAVLGVEQARQGALTPIQSALLNLQSPQTPSGLVNSALALRQFQMGLPLEQQRLDLEKQRLEQQAANLSGSGGGGGGNFYVPTDFGQLGGPTGIQQTTTPTLGGGISTGINTGTDAFRRRALSGGIPEATVTFGR